MTTFTPNSADHRIGTRQCIYSDLVSSVERKTIYGLQAVQYLKYSFIFHARSLVFLLSRPELKALLY